DNEGKAIPPDGAFRLSELYDRLGRDLWSELDARSGDIPAARRDLQRDHAGRLSATLLRPPGQGRADARSLLRQQAQGLVTRLDAAQRRAGLSAEARAHLADVADQFLVFAWTDLDKKRARDHSGLSAFIVERGWEGVSTGSLHGKLGVRAGNTGYLAFADVRVPAENLVYGEGQGFKIAMFCLDQGRYTVAAGSCGLIRACRDASVAYALDRRTFEQPIGEHQLVKQMIANMEAGYEYCTYLWMKAGWLKNRGVRSTKATSLAKWIACREAEAAAANAVQVFGAYGFSDEYPVERFYRNAKGASIYEGTREIHTLMQADYALGFRSDKQLERDLPEAEQ
ncbi:MAG TPA: acyl-CoA dehydrogenase family protein, partial [Verrucomicrobiota bacterium]|nr:acyl-CoA dehydrogenase family protein [Verrucomicrobiota bacterium]